MLQAVDEGACSSEAEPTAPPLSSARESLGRTYSRVSIDAEEATHDAELDMISWTFDSKSPWCRSLSTVVGIVLVVHFVASTVLLYRLQVDEPTRIPDDNLKLYFRPLPAPDAILTHIAFGSCASQHMPQPHLDTLVEYGPNLTLLMGDNVYGDCNDDNCTILRQAYRDFAALASVQGAAPHLSVLATLDDHDYGANDCYRNNPYKEIARKLFEDFFSLQGQLPPDGVYQAHAWGPPGQRLQVIVLDTRYERSAFIEESHDQYVPAPMNDTTRTMLGERQWQWLDEQLKDAADLRILVSSIQFLNNGTQLECWRHLPREQRRLMDLLAGKSTIIVSGDRHVGAFYEADGFFEITASSWTHSVPQLNCSTPRECDEDDPNRTTDFVRDNNFGTVEIDWAARSYTVALRRAESTPGLAWHTKFADAGEIFDSMVYKGVF